MEHQLKIPKTARYELSAEPHAGIKTVWFVLHGYGHLVKYFLEIFRPLFGEDILFVAPEGLHRYYLNGSHGRVGASWMTKEARDTDISDYVNYLDLLAEEIIKKTGPGVSLNLLGFSQGGATASRWAALGRFHFDHLVLWAGFFPPDMEFMPFQKQVPKQITLVMGDQDEFIKMDDLIVQENTLKSQRIGYSIHHFNGKHEMPEQELRTVLGIGLKA